MRRTARRIAGMARVVGHLTWGAATMAAVFPFIGDARRRRIVKRWSDGVLDIFGLTLEIEGQPAGVTETAQSVARLLEQLTPSVAWSDDPTKVAALWQARSVLGAAAGSIKDHATRVATDAVRFAYTAAGTDALRPSVLQRCFRDLHASTQHLVVDNNTLTETTRVLLGLEA